MPDVDKINSNLGALEKQLDELSRLKGLVQSLSQREAAAGEAVQAAKQASSASKEVIERFEDAATRIEEAEVVEQFEEIGDTIRRFEEAGRDLDGQIGTLLETVREQLTEQRDEILESHSEITGSLTSAREEWGDHRDQTSETLDEISNKIESINELLQEVQLRSRLETLQNTASSANQAAQNVLSRIDAVERSLSDTLEEHRRQQDRQVEQLKGEIADLRGQLGKFETSAKRLLWVVLLVGILSLGLAGLLAYVLLIPS